MLFVSNQLIELLHHHFEFCSIGVFKFFNECFNIFLPIHILYHNQDKAVEVKLFLFYKLLQIPAVLKEVDVTDIDDQQSLFDLACLCNKPRPQGSTIFVERPRAVNRYLVDLPVLLQFVIFQVLFCKIGVQVNAIIRDDDSLTGACLIPRGVAHNNVVHS